MDAKICFFFFFKCEVWPNARLKTNFNQTIIVFLLLLLCFGMITNIQLSLKKNLDYLLTKTIMNTRKPEFYWIILYFFIIIM
jgi:hypothetical protein